MVKIRLQRGGAKRRPHYRIIAIDERRKRQGRALEFLGTYDPMTKPETIHLRLDRLQAWMDRGAQLSESVGALVRKAREQGPEPAAEAAPAGEAPPPASAAPETPGAPAEPSESA